MQVSWSRMKLHIIFLISISLFQEVYPIGHETAKVILYIKKYSKHDCNNYDPIYLLPNIENFLNDTYTIYIT